MIQSCMVQKVKLIIASVAVLPELLEEKEYKKPLFICDEGIKTCGILEKATAPLLDKGFEYAVFSEVIADPPEWLAQKGFDVLNAAGCDCIVGIGGGSAIDTAKAVNILRYNDGPIMRFAKGEDMNPAQGLIVIPTTSGTGSEMSDGLVITDGHTKAPILADKAMCEYAILDSELTVNMPPALTATTGFDALSHVVEAYTSTAANGFTDMICEKVMETVKQWLPVAVRDGSNLKAREMMSIASSLGGWMLTQAHTNAGHSVAHVLGGYFKIPHGLCCAYALPEIVAFNATALPEKTKWIAKCFGCEVLESATAAQAGAAARKALTLFRDDALGIRKSTSFAYDSEKFQTMAKEITEEPFQAFNPVKMNENDAVAVLKAIFEEE